jgi:hypothetical protein
MNLQSLIARLHQDFDAVAETALSAAAERLADDVRAALSTPPGGPHDHPWLQTGALRDSVEVTLQASGAVVASTSPVAAYQEFGTATLPPRPTFAPLAASTGSALAQSVGYAVARSLGVR